MELASRIHAFDLPTNRLYGLRDRLVRRRLRVRDLVSANATAQGIRFPPRLLKAALARAAQAAATYKPDPLGQPVARAGVRRYYASEGLSVPLDQIVLTPGTSVSYWYVFKLLANPGDEILCPVPSYPLFDSIAKLCDVTLTSYPLRKAVRWEIDFERLEEAVTPRTKAIILISPHNPTGAVATEKEVEHLAGIASRHGLAIISDEVFCPFLFKAARLPRPAASQAPLVFTLNGLSKMLALPGLKIGWIAVTGDPALIRRSLKALDMISDTFLPVNEIAQFAVPELLKKSAPFRKEYQSDVRKRMELAVRLLRGNKTFSFVQPEGGFYLTLRLEGSRVGEEDLAVRLLEKHRILVHPGYFYDMGGNHLIVSFIHDLRPLRQALLYV